jgi:uncharacterized protein YegJ (DUF2314 family)
MKRFQALLLAVVVIVGFIIWRTYSPEGEEPAARPTDERLGEGEAGPPGDPVPAGSLLAEKTSFVLAVFHPQEPKDDPAETVQAILKNRNLKLRLEQAAGEDTRPPAVVVRRTDTKTYPVPPEDLIQYFGRGLSRDDVSRLNKSRHVTTLWFLSPPDGFLEILKEAYLLAGDLAAGWKGFVWDEETRECFTPRVFSQRRIEAWKDKFPLVTDHIVLHAYSTGDLNRAITLGMAKFGLPDIYIKDFPRSYVNGMGILTNLVAQSILEKPHLEKEGLLHLDLAALSTEQGKEADKLGGRATLHVAVGTREEGDPMNRLIEAVFPGKPETLNVRQEALLEKLFGPGSDGVVSVEHNQELLAASREAKKHVLEKLKPRFKAGLAPGERLSVKAPFKTPEGGQEWMWIEVVRWEGDKIYGILMNDPHYIPGLKSGARVETTEGVVFDYIHETPDGKSEGNETGKIMQRLTR